MGKSKLAVIQVARETHDRLKVIAAKKGVPLYQLVTSICSKWLENRGIPDSQ